MKYLSYKKFEKANAFGKGDFNQAFARYFAGNSYLNPLTNPHKTVFLANVTFEPGCRNNWHIHHATQGGGQMLVCTAGEGWYQERRQSAREPRARQGHRHSGQRKTLARREEGQLVLPHRL